MKTILYYSFILTYNEKKSYKFNQERIKSAIKRYFELAIHAKAAVMSRVLQNVDKVAVKIQNILKLRWFDI